MCANPGLITALELVLKFPLGFTVTFGAGPFRSPYWWWCTVKWGEMLVAITFGTKILPRLVPMVNVFMT